MSFPSEPVPTAVAGERAGGEQVGTDPSPPAPGFQPGVGTDPSPPAPGFQPENPPEEVTEESAREVPRADPENPNIPRPPAPGDAEGEADRHPTDVVSERLEQHAATLRAGGDVRRVLTDLIELILGHLKP